MAGQQIPARCARFPYINEIGWLTPKQAHLDRDPVVRAHRVALQAKDGHALWVNSRVLEESMPLPNHVDGGLIIRDEVGAPTGAFQRVRNDILACASCNGPRNQASSWTTLSRLYHFLRQLSETWRNSSNS